MKLLTSSSGTNQTDMSFTSGIDSTYKLYLFQFISINPATDSAYFQFQANASGQSGYNETITSNSFQTSHGEDDSTSLA